MASSAGSRLVTWCVALLEQFAAISIFDVALSIQVVILSHSGSTSELLALPTRFQDAGCCVVSIVGDAASQLAAASNFVGPTSTRHEDVGLPLTPTGWLSLVQVLAIEAQDDAACPVPSRSVVAQVRQLLISLVACD
jgi:hypothetical protein